MTTAKRIAVSALCLVLVAAATILAVFLLGKGTPVYAAGAFEYTDAVRAEGGSTEGSRRGLRLYGYDSGATARFRNIQTDVFSAELQIGSHDGKSDLKKYSLVFTDVNSGKYFAVQVSAYSDYNDVGVICGGEKGGIVYLERANAAYGATAGYNAAGTYTRFTSDTCSLTFDPASMQVRVKADDGSYRVVWDFTKQYNDGKLLENDLPLFGEYTVSVVLDEIPANSRGDLMIYSFGGYSLVEETVSYRPTILITRGLRPVVGDEFTLPAARVTDGDGRDASEKITAVVYDESGTVLAENVGKFTPQKAETLYICYSYENGEEKADLWYRTVAVDASSVSAKFTVSGELPENVGVGAKFTIPKAKVTSDLIEAGEEDCLVTVYRNGTAIADCTNVPAGFVFEVKEAGNYEIVYGGALSGGYATRRYTFTADAAKLAVNTEIPDGFAKGTIYRFPAAGFCLGTERAEAEAVVVFPSGKEATGDVTLDEVGKYTVRYRATIGGTAHTHEENFLVRAPYADDFDGGDPTYAHMRGNNEYAGIRLSLAEDQTVTYKKAIDFSEYTFDSVTNTGRTLAEISFDPAATGTSDIDSFYVVFTDKYDPTNYITVRLKYLSYSSNASFVRARGSDQASWVGYYYDFSSTEMSVDSAAIHDEGGFISSASFTHVLDSYDFGFNSLKLYFDYATKCLYAQPMWLVGHDDGTHPEYNDRTVPWLVYDFDAEGKLSAGNRPWEGFTTGEALLSVYAKGISGTTDVFLLNVGGEDLSESLFDDREAPTVTVDVDRDNIPAAKVGTPYKVFDFTADDADSAVVDRGVIVTHDATGREAELDASGRFVPLEGGYTLTYYAVDAFGYRTEEKIRVTAARNVDTPSVALAGDLPRTADYGQSITLPACDITSGGAGLAKVTVTVICGDVTIPVSDGKFDCIGATGVYRVAFTVTDYIGQTSRIEKKISVSLSGELQFDEATVSLPAAFLQGDAITFGAYTAVYYNERLEKITIPAVVTVTDGNGTNTIAPGQTYVPAASATVREATVNFTFSADGKTRTVTRTVPIVSVENGENFMAGYFVTENAVRSSSSNGLTFTPAAAGAEMRFSFVRAVWAEKLQLRFIADASTFGTSSFTVTLTDSMDGGCRVTLRYTLVRGTWYCAVGDGTPTSFSPDGDGYLPLSYDNTTLTFTDALGRSLGTVAKTADGRDFEGFSSGCVYLDCSLDGTADTAVGLRTINNQTVNSVKRDMQRPYLKVDGDYEGRVAAGTVITLLPATVYDVLNPLGDITVTVKIGNKTVLAEHKYVPGETFTASECGTYTITYKVTDAAGNTMPEKVEFAAYDPIRPTLHFDGTVDGKARLGQTIKLPSYTVSDDLPDSVTVYTYLFSPGGTREKLAGDSVTFTQRGIYTITYLAVDTYGNMTLYRFTVTVG